LSDSEHLDLDVLDPEEFPHTTYPTPGGPSIKELNVALQTLISEVSLPTIEPTVCGRLES
jgi:arginase family enzyme